MFLYRFDVADCYTTVRLVYDEACSCTQLPAGVVFVFCVVLLFLYFSLPSCVCVSVKDDTQTSGWVARWLREFFYCYLASRHHHFATRTTLAPQISNLVLLDNYTCARVSVCFFIFVVVILVVITQASLKLI